MTRHAAVTVPAGYVLDDAGARAGPRPASLESLDDPGIRGHVERIGVEPGWRCLEIGGGGGSVADWLARRVGPAGRVTVTDIDPHWLTRRVPSNVEILRHDVGVDPLPEGAYDLVHARLVLVQVPERGAALRRMAAALRPGGWLLVEDFDCRILGYHDGPDRELADTPLTGSTTVADTLVVARVLRAIGRVMTASGVDLAYGRRLHGLLCGAGLVDVAAAGHLEIGAGGSPLGALHRASMERLRGAILAAGLVTAAEIDRACQVVMDPGSAVVTPGIMISARGRRPPTPRAR